MTEASQSAEEVTRLVAGVWARRFARILEASYATGISLRDHIEGGWSFTDALPRTTDLEEC